jgi:S-adenosylmethionine:tRNA ribosyltransferase-isomerase
VSWNSGVRLELFDYTLPPERIAQTPLHPRDASRLLVVPAAGDLEHRRFTDLPGYLNPGDLLVFNDTRVLPARLRGVKETGARVEALLLVRIAEGRWEALVHPGRRVREGARVVFGNGALAATVVGRGAEGTRLLQFEAPGGENTDDLIHHWGKAPLPPYIHEELDDPERYQTIYAREEGSAAAPTAGLHFTPRVLDALRDRGVRFAWVTLHVGLATFRPVKTEEIEAHEMHAEWYSVPPETASAVAACSGRVVAVGTTTLRCLESAAEADHRVRVGSGVTRLYVTPGYRFRVAELLLTNFPMPRSSLLILVSAFSSRERIVEAYEEALRRDYRFLSFGDAMLLEPSARERDNA